LLQRRRKRRAVATRRKCLLEDTKNLCGRGQQKARIQPFRNWCAPTAVPCSQFYSVHTASPRDQRSNWGDNHEQKPRVIRNYALRRDAGKRSKEEGSKDDQRSISDDAYSNGVTLRPHDS